MKKNIICNSNLVRVFYLILPDDSIWTFHCESHLWEYEIKKTIHTQIQSKSPSAHHLLN